MSLFVGVGKICRLLTENWGIGWTWLCLIFIFTIGLRFLFILACLFVHILYRIYRLLWQEFVLGRTFHFFLEVTLLLLSFKCLQSRTTQFLVGVLSWIIGERTVLPKLQLRLVIEGPPDLPKLHLRLVIGARTVRCILQLPHWGHRDRPVWVWRKRKFIDSLSITRVLRTVP